MSGSVMLTFGVSLIAESAGFDWIVPYVDPILVIALVLMVGIVPFQIIVRNWRQIVQMAPDRTLQDQVEQIVSASLREAAMPPARRSVRIVRVGRLVYIQLYLIVSEEQASDLGLVAQDALRQTLHEMLSRCFPSLALDVIFSVDPIWSMRSINSPANF